jgi:hypothetical protein
MQQTHEAVMQNATAHKQQIYADPSHVCCLTAQPMNMPGQTKKQSRGTHAALQETRSS